MDKALFFWINNSWSHPLLDSVFITLSSQTHFAFPLLCTIGAWLIWRFKLNGLWVWLIFLIAIALGDQLGTLLKHFFAHPRPNTIFCDQVIIPRNTDNRCSQSLMGMPSNHALNFFLAASFLTVTVKRAWLSVSMLIIACLVAISRIYLGKHFPYQVGFGAFIGMILGVTFALIALQWLPFIRRLQQGNQKHGK